MHFNEICCYGNKKKYNNTYYTVIQFEALQKERKIIVHLTCKRRLLSFEYVWYCILKTAQTPSYYYM